MENPALKESGYEVAKLGSLNPKIVIFDVPRELKEDEILDRLWNQNDNPFKEITKEELETNTKFRFRMGKRREDLTNWVVEVSPKIRAIMRKEERIRVYIDWQACRVQNFKGVTRCFKCQQYGHVQKYEYCKEEEKTCAYCAKEGHMTEDCPDKKAIDTKDRLWSITKTDRIVSLKLYN